MNNNIQEALAKASPTGIIFIGNTQIEMVRIPPGQFLMGSPATGPGHSPNEGPTRLVQISKAFYIGKYEITRTQFQAVMGNSSPVSNPEDGALPMADVTYKDALEFCRRLSLSAKVNVRLPTEAEWEYACRAGTQTPYYSGTSKEGLGQAAWYSDNSGKRAHPVAQKQPNRWGLYDMHGNVWEYCADFIEDYATMGAVDPIGSVSPNSGAMRGGGWMHGPESCRSATRMISDDMFGGAGLRIAISGE